MDGEEVGYRVNDMMNMLVFRVEVEGEKLRTMKEVEVEMSFYVMSEEMAWGLEGEYQKEDLVGAMGMWRQTFKFKFGEE